MSSSSASNPDEPHPKLINSPSDLSKLLPISISGREALSTPFRFVLMLADPQTEGPAFKDMAKAWLGKPAGIDLAPLDQTGENPNYIQGVIAAAEILGSVGDPDSAATYRVEIVPKLWLLSLVRQTRVFTNQTPLDVVKSVLDEGGVTVDMRAAASKMVHPGALLHITQYDETDLDFVSRLLEQEGVCYWFEHSTSGSTMVLANETGDFPGESAAVDIEDKGAALHPPSGVGLRVSMVPSESAHAAYDYNDPNTPRSGSKAVTGSKAPVGQGSWSRLGDLWVSGGQIVDQAVAIETDRHLNRACTFEGYCSDVRFRAGRRVKLPDGDCLLLSVDHAWTHPLAGGKGDYSNRFSWVSWSVLPWRPPRTTPRPRLDAVVPGVITATAGDQAGADEGALDGSYKVRLLDPAATERVARLAQPYAGTGRGMHFPLPPDTEVLLAHIDGNPDMPVIAHAMPNFNHPGPVAEANKTQCVVKTAAGHTLVFEDKEGEEGIALTSKSGHKLVLEDKDGAEKATFSGKGADSLVFDEKSGSEKISLTATKDHEVTVAGKSVMTVTGTTEVTCKDEITISSDKKITLKVGSASIVIDSNGKITIDATDIELTGSSSLKAKAPQVEVAGDTSLKAKGGQVEITADSSLKAGGSMVEVTANASMKLDGGGMLEAKGGMIKLN